MPCGLSVYLILALLLQAPRQPNRWPAAWTKAGLSRQTLLVIPAAVAVAGDREGLERQILPRRSADRVGGEVALHRPVIQGIVQGGHDHGLVEDEIAVANLLRYWIHGIVEATVGPVDVRVERPQLLNVGVGLLRQDVEGDEGRMRGHHILGGTPVALRQPLIRMAGVSPATEVGEQQAVHAKTAIAT